MSSSDAMSALREAIVADVREDNEAIGELTMWHRDLVDAWNAVCEASPTVGIPEPITDEDLIE